MASNSMDHGLACEIALHFCLVGLCCASDYQSDSGSDS